MSAPAGAVPTWLGPIRQTAFLAQCGGQQIEGFPYLEFVDPAGGMKVFFDRVAGAAQDWDGSDPLR
ncbi:MAG: hypothetical protein ACKO91_13320 [Acidimicrobiales bacterium]